MSDFITKGDKIQDGLADFLPRFSIFFDVPTDSAVTDFVLLTGDGQRIALVPYISEEYLAEHPGNQ